MKVCTKCKRNLPRDVFRKYAGRSLDGLRPLCKECQRSYEAAWRKENHPRLAAVRERRASKEKAYRQEYDARRRGYLLLMEAKRRSSRKSIPFDLDQHIQEIEDRIQRKTCEMTGMTLDLHAKGIKWNSPSLDRIDPKKGYLYENIRVVCFAINLAMSDWGEDVLRKIMSAWLERQ